jgi:putative spermidine/putrescine transport system substrate-binding protein
LVIRIWGGNEETVWAETAGAAFTADTGIPIVWDTTDEAVSYAKINEEIQAGTRPSVDASFNAQQRASINAARGWTIPISTALAPNMLLATAETARPEGSTEDFWPYTVPYTLTVPFIIRTDKIDPEKVKSWEDLYQSELQGAIAIDALYSSTAFGIAQSIGVDPTENPPSGMESVWERIADLKPNLAQLGSNEDLVTALINGSVSVVVSNMATGVAAIGAGAPVTMVAPDNGLYVVGDAYFINKGIPDENAYYAQVFANYLFDLDVQSAVAERIGWIPVRPDATVPSYMSDNPGVFPRTLADLEKLNAIVAPISLMAKNEAEWQQAFEAALR